MIVCLDVHYKDDGATGAAIAFQEWSSPSGIKEWVVQLGAAAEYVPGEFYKRELPCLLKLLDLQPAPASTVVVDGYVWLDEDRPGLGAHLYRALNEAVAVVGVAKNEFAGAAAVPVFRGNSKLPLYVSSAGTGVAQAAMLVATMHGNHRIPALLKRVDALARRA